VLASTSGPPIHGKGRQIDIRSKHLTVRLFLSPTESDDVSCGSNSEVGGRNREEYGGV
jgi:hypothetical protein